MYNFAAALWQEFKIYILNSSPAPRDLQNRRDGAGKAGPGPPKKWPHVPGKLLFLEPRVGDRPGHPQAAQVKKVKNLIKNLKMPARRQPREIASEFVCGADLGATGAAGRAPSI